ncbi:MAG: MFS transporter [Mycobacterium sp.]|nr:MFS transporter [Mycobacterium sp.]
MANRGQEMRALIRSPEYGKLVVAQTVSTAGTGASALTLTVLVTQWLGLAGMSEYLLATTIPGLVLGAAAGVLTDRRSRRTLVVTADIVRSVVTLALVVVDRELLWVLFALMIARTTISVFGDSANNALMPSLVPKNLLTGAYGLQMALGNVARVGGMGLGGLLVNHANVVFVFDAATFLAAAALRWFVREPPRHASNRAPANSIKLLSSWVRDASDGAVFLIRQHDVRTALVYSAAITFSGATLTALYTPYILITLHSPAWWIAAIEAIGVGGIVVSGILVQGITKRLGTTKAILIGGISVGITFAAYSLVKSVWIVAVIEVPNGLAIGLLQACLPAIIALNTPNELLGRTNAALDTTTQAGFLLSLPVAGALAQGIGVRSTFWIAAGAVIAATILIYGRTVTR